MTSVIERLLLRFPTKPWSWSDVSFNSNVSIDFIQQHPEFPWDWEQVACNPNLTIEFVRAHPNIPWNWKKISQNFIFTTEWIDAFPHVNWDWYQITHILFSHYYSHSQKETSYTFIHFEYLREHPDYPWRWDILSHSHCKELTIQFIRKFRYKPWNWDILSRNTIITMDDIRANLDLPWNWSSMNHHRLLDAKMIKQFPDKYWEWDEIARYCWNIEEIVKALPHVNWDWNELSHNEHISMDFINAFAHKPWNWIGISINFGSYITLDDVRANLDKPWNWNDFDLFMNISKSSVELIKQHPEKKQEIYKQQTRKAVQFILDNPDKPFTIPNLMYSMNVDCSIVDEYPDEPWNWEVIMEYQHLSIDLIKRNLHHFTPRCWNQLVWNKKLSFDFIQKHHAKLNFRIISLIEYDGFPDILHKYNYYFQKKCAQFHHIMKNELLMVAWNPSRFQQWCLDQQEQKMMMERWSR